ncbi:acetyl-CoA carboxylase biotin carboxyl carrier protein [Pandoraea sputorum]|uniref:acetyl-CoA carboxylase biotin carboxyl carrier protein n=1 Tax=Pandoraea sputorum TaxID=93222 RepID=UPI0012410476|nr:biotin/lipoyl-containing protein [Pandoraea sputorum]VVE78669.1 hypothetical protein PSP31120_01794 [Pandoraea sputorum]
MTLEDIGEIVATLEASDVIECEVTSGAHALRIRLDRVPQPVVPLLPKSDDEPAVAAATAQPVLSPATGFLRLRHPLGDSLLTPGLAVKTGQIVAYLEVESVLSPIVATVDGVIGAINVSDGDLVTFGASIVDVHP